MILITGGEGQLGKSLTVLAKSRSYSYVSLNRKELDITDKFSVHDVITRLKPELVVNCAAWTNVEEAENYPKQATEINAYGALHLANACKSIGTRFFQISTDYVFSGNNNEPWQENDVKSPTSHYGVSKSDGEDFVLNSYPEGSFIIRTSWLYGAEGENFLTKILKKIDSQEKNLRIVDDQIGQPTSVSDLAIRILEMSDMTLKSKIYHASNTGQGSWFDFASKILSLKNHPSQCLTAIQTEDYVSIAKRPPFSVLGQSAWSDSGLSPMRNWEEALTEVLNHSENTIGDLI